MTSSPRDMLMSLLVTSYPDLRRRLAGRLGSLERANDALHDTYVRLHRAEITGEVHNPNSYLLTMALNIASNSARAEAKHLSAAEIDQLISLADDLPDPARTAEARSELAAVERALEELPSRRRAIFTRFWVEEASYKELASAFDISERTVRHELLLASRYLHKATEKFSLSELQDRLSKVSSY